MLSAGDLGVEIDYGVGNPHGTLQRFENGDWQDYRPDGEQEVSPVEIGQLAPGRCRLVER